MVEMVLLGIATGMRSMTALAVLCWFAWLGLLPATGWAHWSATAVAAIVFGLCALGEYAGDISPNCPNRTSAFPVIARLLIGGLVGVFCARAMHQPNAGGALFGLVGVLIGAYGGMPVRLRLAKKLGRDWPVGLAESAVALGISVLAAVMIHHDVLKEAEKLKRFVM